MAAMSKMPADPPPGLAQSATRAAVKRALIIGINYTHGSQAGELHGTHNDARAWRDMLLETYDYRNEDITLMLDRTDTPPDLLPTRKNILHHIYRLVTGLESGDRVVFFYAGHSHQVESKSVNEDDGFDEALVPVDHNGEKSGLIIDNDLRRLLVEPLPEGASLTAIFDSCHSGTLLDLDHYMCNAVYFPWLSRGQRRSKSLWQLVGRKHARDQPKRNVRVTSLSSKAAAKTYPTPLGGRADVRVYCLERMAKDRVLRFDTSIDELSANEKGEKRFVLTRSSSMQVKRSGPFPGLNATIERCSSFDHSYRQFKKVGSRLLKARNAESPEPLGG